MGADSKQALGMFQQMGDMLQRAQKMSVKDAGPDYGTAAEEQARMIEIDAGADARDAQRDAMKTARAARSSQEQERARRNAQWGKSGLIMSGSKQLIKDAQSIKDMQDEEDILFEGQQEADGLLAQGRRKANMLRINNNGQRRTSTLSLGSKIYGPRR